LIAHFARDFEAFCNDQTPELMQNIIFKSFAPRYKKFLKSGGAQSTPQKPNANALCDGEAGSGESEVAEKDAPMAEEKASEELAASEAPDADAGQADAAETPAAEVINDVD